MGYIGGPLDAKLHRCNSIKVNSSYVHQYFFRCEHGDEAFVELVEGLACTCEMMIGTLMGQVKQSISSMERMKKNTRNWLLPLTSLPLQKYVCLVFISVVWCVVSAPVLCAIWKIKFDPTKFPVMYDVYTVEIKTLLKTLRFRTEQKLQHCIVKQVIQRYWSD